MADALVFDVPAELGLELAAVVRPHLADTEWEALDDAVEEVDALAWVCQL